MNKFVVAALGLFAVLVGITFYCKTIFPLMDTALMVGANLLLLIVTLVAYFLVKKNLKESPNAFVRGVYSGTFLKMFVLLISLLIYVIINKDTLHKPSLFAVFGFYILYAGLEAFYLGKMAKKS